MESYEYLMGILIVLICGLIWKLIRRRRLINFLIFCGEEMPDYYFAKVVNPLTYLDLEFYDLSLLYYFKKVIRDSRGYNLETAFNNLNDVKSLRKQDLCRKTFLKALNATEVKKLGEIYLQSFRVNEGANSKLAAAIFSIAAGLEGTPKFSFIKVLSDEFSSLAHYNFSINRPIFEALEKVIELLKEPVI